MVELVLTLNDRSGKYAQHAGVVLASIFSNTQQTVNVHILYDETLTEENKFKLTQLTEGFNHNIYFYFVSVPEDMVQASAQVHKIDHWTVASMYRLLLPNIIPAEKVIYLDCDIWVNTDINELWSTDLGGHYLGAILDQGQNLDEYFASMGLNGAVYFNSGVILFHLDNIRNKPGWYEEMLNFLRNYPTTTMPDQDVLNSLYASNYLQLDQRFNTFAHEGLDPENKIVHFAGEDNKWWNDQSPAAPLYNSFLAMTPWAGAFTPAPAPAAEPQVEAAASQPPVDTPVPPAPEVQHVESQHAEARHPETPAPKNTDPLPAVPTTILPQTPATPVKRKRRRSLRLRLRPRLRKKRGTRVRYRSLRRARRVTRQSLSNRQPLSRRKTLQYAVRKVPVVRKKIVYVIRKAPLKKSTRYLKRSS
ncbi:glycosyltransferase family 8 protein [Paenibacillus jiagnxiensis]|uniref:glycosyltransferase family 8 protein n=1 Tax=Paenibacillus jiagnxiensis TaxID=3228926 RepID=UPI0033B0A5AB